MSYLNMFKRFKKSKLLIQNLIFLLIFGISLAASEANAFGYDSANACSPNGKLSRRGRAQLIKTIPCDLSQQAFCNLPGSAYPWHAVRRFVHENQGLMKRMYGDVRHISILRDEITNNEIEIEDVEIAQARYSKDGSARRSSKFMHMRESEYSSGIRNNDVLKEPHFRPVVTTTTSRTTTTTTTKPSTSNASAVSDEAAKIRLTNKLQEQFKGNDVSGDESEENSLDDDDDSGAEDEDLDADDDNLESNSVYGAPSTLFAATAGDNIKMVEPPRFGGLELNNLTAPQHQQPATISTTLKKVTQNIQRVELVKKPHRRQPPIQTQYQQQLLRKQQQQHQQKQPQAVHKVNLTILKESSNNLRRKLNESERLPSTTTATTSTTPITLEAATGATATSTTSSNSSTAAAPSSTTSKTPAGLVKGNSGSGSQNDDHADDDDGNDDDDNASTSAPLKSNANKSSATPTTATTATTTTMTVKKTTSVSTPSSPSPSPSSATATTSPSSAAPLATQSAASTFTTTTTTSSTQAAIPPSSATSTKQQFDLLLGEKLQQRPTTVSSTTPASAANTAASTKPVLRDGQLFQDTIKQEPPPVLNARGVNACPVKEEVVAPFWANNTRGEVLALLNLYPFEQYVHWEKCVHEHKQMYCRDGCRCEQQYRLHRLLAYDPHNECRGIFSDWFRFPSSCICKCYDIPMDFRATSRSPRSERSFQQQHDEEEEEAEHVDPIERAEEAVKRAIYEHATEDWYRPKDDFDLYEN